MARAQDGAGAPVATGDLHTTASAYDGPTAASPGADPAPTALFSCSLSGTVLAAGAALARLSGRPLVDVAGVPAHELLHASSRERLQDILRATRDGALSGATTLRFRHVAGSDLEVPTSWAVLAGGSADATQLVFVRLDGRPARERPHQDGPEPQPDRRQLLARLTCALGRADHPTAVLMVDLDHFRMVNASHGHDVGDRLLAGIGARLRAAVSRRQIVARCGDDEFAVICEDTDELQAHALARRLLDAVAEPFLIGDGAVHVTASIGVAVAPAEPTVSAMDLLRRADTAVHAGKNAGRGRVHVFEQALGQDVAHRYALATDLRAALADAALRLEYQPIVDLPSGAVIGMEALARWTHPERGPVSPSSFVTVAEFSGLAPELDRWVIQRAVQDMARLRQAGVVPEDAYVAVNLSAASLTDASVLDHLVSCTDDFGLPATQLVIEITETAIMRNTDLAVALPRQLRKHGFRVAMDDFGTGYSSLAYLRDLPISTLKLDRSFVADLTEQRDALAIVAWVVDLARTVGVAVVAEGVETAEHAALLQELGCVTAQGWLWGPARPMTALLSGREWSTPLATGSGQGPRAGATRPVVRDAGIAHGLQRLLQLHRNGANIATITAALNAEGFRTPTGRRWRRSTVARLISERIRRSARRPDDCPNARRVAWRVEPAARPPARSPSGTGGSDVQAPPGADDAGWP
ncbi:EAL domain-containing protein [Modestobacter marinus]|uniref:EAL domain-containing protein n=1 Tax=Modestobacter marinus TaxID=477641 RepID=UPI001C93892C|nr:EAL domain-containing protein [Modestobacter marinus]